MNTHPQLQWLPERLRSAESLACHGVGAECLEAQSRVTLCNPPFVGLLGVVFLKKKTEPNQRGYKPKDAFLEVAVLGSIVLKAT